MSDAPAHRAQREALGAYVLGHLPEPEAEDVRRHVAGCDACRAELDELAPVAAALTTARAPGADPAVPSAELPARIEERIRSEQRRARFGPAARLAAVAAATAVLVLAGLRLTAPNPEPVVPLEAVPVVASRGVDADADLVAHTWGVEIKLTASGLESGARYDVTVLDEDGEQFSAGAFVGVTGQMRCNLNAAVLRADAASFVVRDERGKSVLRSRFST